MRCLGVQLGQGFRRPMQLLRCARSGSNYASEVENDMLAATPMIWLQAQWRAWRLGAQTPASVQEAELKRLLRRAAPTRFGRDHGFESIRTVAEFQERVPLRRYEDFWNDYWQEGFPRLEDCSWPGLIPYFARTSGTTTGVTKFIPCSREMLDAYRRASWDALYFHLLSRPASRILGGKTFMLGGSTDLRAEAPGVRSGDMSGLLADDVPDWARPYTFPSRELALIADWEEKIDRIAPLALAEDIRAISGTTSWLLAFFEKLAELRPQDAPRIASWFPDLEMLMHGGMDFRPYAGRFAELMEGSRAELREVYSASEGFIAVADRGQGEGLRLIIDNGLFFEFVPTGELESPAPTRHWLGTVEPGVDYAIVLSTCAGAWGYVIGDTVRFVEVDPPRIVVTGRTSYMLSAFGEHLIAEEIEEAVAGAATAIGASVANYSVAAVVPEASGAKPGHRYVVEFAGGPPEPGRLEAFRAVLDDRLRALNTDYSDHRAGDFGLGLPQVEPVAPGTFLAWIKHRGQLGGQHKVPRIINDAKLFADLLAFVS